MFAQKEINAVIFDFDGVICESDKLKTRAYYNLYLPYGEEIARKAIEYHLNNAGVSRIKKIPYIHKNILHKDISDSELKEWVSRYSENVYSQVIDAPLSKGCIEFLQLHYKKINLFISSGTPQDEMRSIIDKKNLSYYFKEVYGSPDTKQEHIKRILINYNLKAENTIFVGDATTDRDAALQCGLIFVARITDDSMLRNETYRINDFSEFNI